MSVFHVELRQFPHSARGFNLADAELHEQIVGPWLQGAEVEWGQRRFDPRRAQLTIIAGRALRPDELGMGRGWSEAAREGEDVTKAVLEHATRERADAPLAALKRHLLERCEVAPEPLSAVMESAAAMYPGHRASEQLALAEQAVWELLHEERVELLRAGADDASVAADEWSSLLLSWPSWGRAERVPHIAPKSVERRSK